MQATLPSNFDHVVALLQVYGRHHGSAQLRVRLAGVYQADLEPQSSSWRGQRGERMASYLGQHGMFVRPRVRDWRGVPAVELVLPLMHKAC